MHLKKQFPSPTIEIISDGFLATGDGIVCKMVCKIIENSSHFYSFQRRLVGLKVNLVVNAFLDFFFELSETISIFKLQDWIKLVTWQDKLFFSKQLMNQTSDQQHCNWNMNCFT